MPHRFPLIAPNPPRLSTLTADLERVERSGIFSNYGPEARAFEADATDRLFGGTGACLTVANATLGLMIAIRDAAGAGCDGRMALMPALTFAATAQAAHWAGLVPLICDIDPIDWTMAAAQEERLLARHGDRIAVIVPYATFGRAIDLDRYAWLAERHGVGVVIDAAASLGTRDAAGRGFGTGAQLPIVFSMHATKTFATAEGGLIRCRDAAHAERLRAMANFGFEHGRSATLPGLNAKLPEISAVLARARLAGFDAVCATRDAVATAYRAALADRYALQPAPDGAQAMQFLPIVLPPGVDRDVVAAALDQSGVGSGRYFSPHLAQQPWIAANAQVEPTPVADDVAARLLSLPITDRMTAADVRTIVDLLDRACRPRPHAVPASRQLRTVETLIVGGGPAGTALLTAATKRGLLPDFARDLMVVERDAAIGGGRLGQYAIASDSTAQTFLTAVENNAHPSLAALTDHPAARAVARHRDSLGVPLAEVGPLLRATGDRLGALVAAHGGEVRTRCDVTQAQRGADGAWQVTIRDHAGATYCQPARNIVIATGGHQPLDRIAGQSVAGTALLAQAGDRLVQSDAMLTIGGYDKVADLLARHRAPRIAVIGGSTSALTTIALLLKGRPALPLGAGAVTLLHRRPLRPFYPSIDAAHADGFDDFDAADICPVSGFVYRLAGFRLEARELVLRMLGIGGRVPDPRVALHRIAAGQDDAAQAIIARADLVIAALGYRPNALPLIGGDGRAIALAADAGRPMVDPHCRVLDAAGAPLPGVYGIGLAAGFVPWGALGGEPSFRGQANGLWLWQNDVGLMIVDQILGSVARRAVA